MHPTSVPQCADSIVPPQNEVFHCKSPKTKKRAEDPDTESPATCIKTLASEQILQSVQKNFSVSQDLLVSVCTLLPNLV